MRDCEITSSVIHHNYQGRKKPQKCKSAGKETYPHFVSNSSKPPCPPPAFHQSKTFLQQLGRRTTNPRVHLVLRRSVPPIWALHAQASLQCLTSECGQNFMRQLFASPGLPFGNDRREIKIRSIHGNLTINWKGEIHRSLPHQGRKDYHSRKQIERTTLNWTPFRHKTEWKTIYQIVDNYGNTN